MSVCRPTAVIVRQLITLPWHLEKGMAVTVPFVRWHHSSGWLVRTKLVVGLITSSVDICGLQHYLSAATPCDQSAALTCVSCRCSGANLLPSSDALQQKLQKSTHTRCAYDQRRITQTALRLPTQYLLIPCKCQK